MIHQIGGHVLAGELHNRRLHSTHGYLLLKGWETPLLFELTGDPDPSLAGRSVRFQIVDPEQPLPPHDPKDLAMRHIGPVGDIRLRMAKRPQTEVAVGDATGRNESPAYVWMPELHIEWSSQNGRVISEIVDPMFEVIEGPPLEQPEAPEDAGSPAIPRSRLRIGGHFINFFADPTESDSQETEDEPSLELVEEEGGDGDEGGELEEYLESLNEARDRAVEGSRTDSSPEEPNNFIDELARVDRIITEEPGEPLGLLLEPRKLPDPDSLSEEEAESLVKNLLAEMALMGVALHVCPHFDYRGVYWFMIEEVFPEMRVHPELKGTGWVQAYDTSEGCPDCERELDERWKQENKEEE